MTTTRRDSVRGGLFRLLAGMLLGYVVTATAQATLVAALALVFSRADAVWLGTMLVLPVLPAAIVYAAAAYSWPRAWFDLAAAAAALGLFRWALP